MVQKVSVACGRDDDAEDPEDILVMFEQPAILPSTKLVVELGDRADGVCCQIANVFSQALAAGVNSPVAEEAGPATRYPTEPLPAADRTQRPGRGARKMADASSQTTASMEVKM